MKTPIFKKIFLLFFIFSLLVLSACSNSKETGKGENINLIISHFQPSTHPLQTDIFPEIGDTLKEETDGRITYELYPANSLGDAGSQYDMAVTGEADIALSVHGYTPGRFPLVTVLELPFLAESGEHGSKIIAKLLEEFEEVKKEHGDTQPLWLFTADPAQIITKSKKVETPDDLKGMRVRSPSPQGNKILEALGAVPVSMPMGDVYEALERGVIDGAMVPLEAVHAYNFHEIIKYITIGHFSSTPFFSVMNKDTYNKLTDSEKEQLGKLTGITASEKSGRIFDENGAKGKKLAEENGVEIIELTGAKLTPWQEALKPITEAWIKEINDKGLPGQEIYDRALQLKEELKK